MTRPGQFSDFEEVSKIRAEVALDFDRLEDPAYRAGVQSSGFLLPAELTPEVFLADLGSYLVADDGNRFLGYLCLHEYQSWRPEHASDVDWLQPQLQDTYFANPHAHMYALATRQRGIGSQLLNAAVHRACDIKSSWLFSMIVTSPVTNIASMLFHERNGFERIAQTRPTHDAGLDGFVNLLYGKRVA